ncbi:MAG: hypothetical protein RLZZ350_1512 [Verrucomicrobiota bacterium]|jgi:hypothetical protein
MMMAVVVLMVTPVLLVRADNFYLGGFNVRRGRKDQQAEREQ